MTEKELMAYDKRMTMEFIYDDPGPEEMRRSGLTREELLELSEEIKQRKK